MKPFEDHEQWSNVKSVCTKLVNGGFKAWLAGGCVRDFILKQRPKDFDVVTNATPDQIQALFPKSLPVGKKFGIIILPYDGYQIEVATFRKDGDYKDGRHPESVSLATPEEDALRRDFTMNALFYDPENQKIIDYVEGEKDIKAKIIRTVGDPHKRFSEDKLRVLRAFRFVAQLNFALDSKTFLAANDFTLNEVSKERIHEEFNKILKCSERVKALSLLDQSGVLGHLWPEIMTKSKEWIKGKMLLSALPHDLNAATSWAAAFLFLLDAKSDECDSVTRRFKFSNEDAKHFRFIVKRFREPTDYLKLRKSERLMTFAEDGGDELYKILVAFVKLFPQTKKSWLEVESEIKAVMPPLGNLPEPFIGAKEIMDMGVSGAQIGKILKSAYSLQLDGDLKTRAEALKWLKSQHVQ